jgi:hypothetical protein
MKQQALEQSIRVNLSWFQNSGIMNPPDGSKGVAERIAILSGGASTEKIHKSFPYQTQLTPDIVTLEHRRPDCCFQTALLFDLAAEAFEDEALKAVADAIIEYLVERCGLRKTDAASPLLHLWGWADPIRRDTCWTDDNAWVGMLLLMLARRGRPELREMGLGVARTLLKECGPFLESVRGGNPISPDDLHLSGMKLNPHWFGLVTMAFAHAAAVDPATDYAAFVQQYHEVVLDGPPADDERSSRPTTTGLPWALSEYAYLALTTSIAAKQFDLPIVADVGRKAADILLRYQEAPGHFRAEHYESPNAPHLADLIYTQNWATLGLYHAAKVFESGDYRAACDRSIEFLLSIQDTSPDPTFAGCWRGMYDTQTNAWGGGDSYEGGAGSIYSGWTNAPISIALLLELTGKDMFA